MRPRFNAKCECGHLGIHHLPNDDPYPCVALAGDCPCAGFALAIEGTENP